MSGREASKVGKIDLVAQSVSLIQNRRLGKLARRNHDTLLAEIRGTRESLLGAVGITATLQLATIEGIIDIKRDISVLSEGLWNLNNSNEAILNHLEDERQRKDQLDTLKLLIIEIESQLDAIDELAETHAVWATFKAKELLDSLNDDNITVDKFKSLERIDDIKQVKAILKRVETTFESLHEALPR